MQNYMVLGCNSELSFDVFKGFHYFVKSISHFRYVKISTTKFYNQGLALIASNANK